MRPQPLALFAAWRPCVLELHEGAEKALFELLTATQRRQLDGHADAAQFSAEFLDERYARGEIDRDEYLQREADLEQ